MKIQVDYEIPKTIEEDSRKISEEREYPETNYTRVICMVMRELYGKGYLVTNIRCLDLHPKDMING